MIRLLTVLSITLPFALVASEIYTGFNYGAFWGVDSNVKKAVDFQESFSYAQNLSSPTPFNSARLFTCKTQGTADEPTGAFDAAVETKTKLLLGFWITPQHRGGPLNDIVKNELSALGKGFQKHGQALADLVIGLSVGSEDIYRWEDTAGKELGVAAREVSATIKSVKNAIASSSYATYMKGKPIGHVDTAKHAVVDGADFYGVTAYPYWNNEPIEKSKESFMGTLNNIKQRGGNTPIWIAEIGWPFEGVQRGDAVASLENLQQYWAEVGCSVVGTYTTFWFELIKDSEPGQPDWGILDSVTHKPRINLSCPGLQSSAPATSASSSPGSPLTSSASSFNPTTLITPPRQSATPASSSMTGKSALEISVTTPLSKVDGQSTTHITTTVEVTVQPSAVSSLSNEEDGMNVTTTITSTVWVTPSSASPKPSFKPPANSSAILPPTITSLLTAIMSPSDVSWCVTVGDIAWNGQYVPVAGGPAGPNGKCSPPPTYSGLPYEPIKYTMPPSSSMSSVRLKSATPSASTPSSIEADASSITFSSSTLKALDVPPTSTSRVITPPSSVAVVPPNAVGSIPSSSATLVISSSSATSVAPSSQAMQRSVSSKHLYCVSQSNSLTRSAASSAPLAPVPSSSISTNSHSTVKSKPSSIRLPGCTFDSGIFAAKEAVQDGESRKR